MLHVRMFTWSFVASGAAVSFLDVLVGVTCATREGQWPVSISFHSCSTENKINNNQACPPNVKSVCEVIIKVQCKTLRIISIYSWCNSNWKYIIEIKQKPFMNADIGLYDKLTEAQSAHWGPWQSTYSTCAVIVTAIVLRRWRRPALALSSQISTSNCTGLPCELTLWVEQ